MFTPAENRIVLLTGRSSFQSLRLHPGQLSFLQAVAPAGYQVCPYGWPYSGLPDIEPREANILAASFRNTNQVLRLLLSRRYRALATAPLHALATATTRHLILITGSCGLEILNAAWPLFTRTTVIALGPSCLRHLRIHPISVIRGNQDTWSRLLYSGPLSAECACGHLDYYSNPEVQSLVQCALTL